jgi:hypothetical protein
MKIARFVLAVVFSLAFFTQNAHAIASCTLHWMCRDRHIMSCTGDVCKKLGVGGDGQQVIRCVDAIGTTSCG